MFLGSHDKEHVSTFKSIYKTNALPLFIFVCLSSFHTLLTHSLKNKRLLSGIM